MTSSRHAGGCQTLAVSGLAVVAVFGLGAAVAEVPEPVLTQLDSNNGRVIRPEGYLYARVHGFRKTPLQPLETLLGLQAAHAISLHLCGPAPVTQHSLRTSISGATVVASDIRDEEESHVIVRVPDQKPACEWYKVEGSTAAKSEQDSVKPNVQRRTENDQARPHPNADTPGVHVRTMKTEY